MPILTSNGLMTAGIKITKPEPKRWLELSSLLSLLFAASSCDAAGDTSRLASCLQYCQYWIGQRFMGNGICNFLLRLCKKI
jgi:hypothetical protein